MHYQSGLKNHIINVFKICSSNYNQFLQSLKGNINGADNIQAPQNTVYGRACKNFVETEQNLDQNFLRLVLSSKCPFKNGKKKGEK